ncbi:MAG: DNA polymerase III subunit alpha [Gammaproteobacteria bacterium]|nr:DNA polymerase III subunit alpha [Gammaproteobacteria bacterium]
MERPEDCFVHLRVHSEYSISDGLIKLSQLAGTTCRKGMPAVGLTDSGNLFGLMKFHRACMQAGVKPLVGSDLRVSVGGNPFLLPVLAMNQIGYKNLLSIVSNGYVGSTDRGVVPIEDLSNYGEGLLVLSGGISGDVGSALVRDDYEKAKNAAIQWSKKFPGRYYLEISRTGRAEEENYISVILKLSEELELPVVATNDVRFIGPEDFEAHEARVCIYQGRSLDDPRRTRQYSADQYLKTPEEMAALFSDIPEALENSVAIAQRCSVSLETGSYHLPNYPVDAGITLEEFLQNRANEGLTSRLKEKKTSAGVTSQIVIGDYQERLSYELATIKEMGFSGYFLIVMEFIAWARENDIPVGPGRGSGAGSLVAYALGITDLDPLEYDLLFERFLNPERVSMPDFDVDFCMEGRDQVIAHVSERYGENAVSQIITFSTMAAKAVVRDVARVQGKPYGLADRLSKLIPFEVGMTLTKAVAENKDLASFISENEEVSEIMEMAYKLEGVIRGVSRHAGGVVIAPSHLTNFVPLYVDEQGGGLVSQYDKDDVETAGLVKFDFLGLKTLTVIDWTVKAINRRISNADNLLKINNIPLDDKETFKFLRTGETTGVFQLESRGMKDLIRRLLPDTIDDIIALVALFRPGPLQSGAVDDYVDRKHGRSQVHYLHPALERLLQSTYGVMLYQEQVMQVAQELAGFSLGQADLLRRAMGKKKPEEMSKVRKEFVEGCAINKISASLANEIFDLMEKFSGYAFNKSHSATYALVSFQTAWLKTHYPSEFMAATLSVDMQNTDKVVTLAEEVRRLDLELLPPNINYSEYRFVGKKGKVIYGLGALRGVGEGPVDAIVSARKAEGEFKNLFDFCARVGPRKANKRVLDVLIRSGAMDDFSDTNESLSQTRARLLESITISLGEAEQSARDLAIGMTDMFEDGDATERELPHAEYTALTEKERLDGEKDALGFYLSGHPIDRYQMDLEGICKSSIADLRPKKGNQIIAGLVVSLRTMRTRRGIMAFAVLDDRTSRIEVTLFSDVYEAQKGKLVKDEILFIEGEVQPDDYTGALKVRANKIYSIPEVRNRFVAELLLHVDSSAIQDDSVENLKSALVAHRAKNGCSVVISYGTGDAVGRLALGASWRVILNDELLSHLIDLFGEKAVNLVYRH